MISILGNLYQTFIHQPIFNALVALYNIIPGQDIGIAIIVLTLLFRFVFYPLSAKGIVAQKKLATLQPKLKELQAKFKDNRERQTKEILAMYKEAGINPLAGILPLLVQLPILIGLYRVFWKGLQDTEQLQFLYSFVANPGILNPVFLGVMDLSEKSIFLAVAAGVAQFFQGKQLIPPKTQEQQGLPAQAGKKDFASTMQSQMLYLFPAITVLIVSQLPSAVGVYWITTSLFSVWQYQRVTRNIT